MGSLMSKFFQISVSVLLAVAMLFVLSGPVFAADKPVITAAAPQDVRIGYSHAIKPVDAEVWGIAQGDLDGDGEVETLLAERGQVQIGKFKGKSFKKTATCSWSGIAQAAAVYAMDLDGDGDDEIVVSAVEEGAPSSMVLDLEGGKCKQLASRLAWSLRVMDVPSVSTGEGTQDRRVLVGQGWSRSSFFAGPIYELKLSGSKLERVKKFSFPWKTRLYQYTFLPNIDGDPAIALQRGYERLSVRKRKGRKYKRVWRSGQRFGGSINYISAEQRVALGSEQSDIVIFDVPPLFIGNDKSGELVALRSDMPLKGFIGRRPYVRGGDIYGFKRDEVFTFSEAFRTKRLPGAITGMINARDVGDNLNRIYVVMIEDPAFFDKASRSIIVSFDLPIADVADSAKSKKP